MKTIKSLTFVPLAALAAMLLFQTSVARAADHGALHLTFEKCFTSQSTAEGTVDGDCGPGTVSYRDLGVAVGTEVVHFGGEYTVTTPGCGTFKALCRGILNTHTGLIVLNGVVTEGDQLGATVQVRAQLIFGANSVCTQGTMTITPAKRR